jgi:hypothetical protein
MRHGTWDGRNEAEAEAAAADARGNSNRVHSTAHEWDNESGRHRIIRITQTTTIDARESVIQFGSGGVRRRERQGMLKFDTLESGFRRVVVVVDMRREIVYVLARSIFSLLVGWGGSRPILLARLQSAARVMCRGGRPRSAGIGGPGGPCRKCEWRGGQWRSGGTPEGPRRIKFFTHGPR